LEWVEQRIADGTIALLENETAMIGVEQRVYPGGLTELHGLFACGDMVGILKLIDLACEGATGICDIAAISSRPGWAKALRSRGFRLEQQTIVKEL
jgi:hypothetical protein